jgi:enterochelin esterase family protein
MQRSTISTIAKPFLAALLVVFTAGASRAQAPFAGIQAFRDSMEAATQIADVSERTAALNVIWDTLSAYGQLPYRDGLSAAFLYRGSALSVQVAGDHNGWNPAGGTATRLGVSDVWMREETFPEDARIDYKFVRDTNQWILDPGNPLRQRGGFGDNSELRMPSYVPSPWVERQAGVSRGNFSANKLIASTNLGYSVSYRVYTPAGYDDLALSDLPVAYVTDGHEYSDDAIGSARAVLDNMIDQGTIVPVMAVFIDPRVGGQNRRVQQYIENADFGAFVAEELVPVIDADYRTDPRRYARAIIGTSLGGLNAAYFAATQTSTFYLIGVQSPAFRSGSQIYDLFDDHEVRDVRVHMSWGTIGDVGNAGEIMADIMSSKRYDFATVVLNEGHSWGAWRALLDDMFEYFWGASSNVSVAGTSSRPAPEFEVFPNPSAGPIMVRGRLDSLDPVRILVYDMLGRQLGEWFTEGGSSGAFRAEIDFTRTAPGVYLFRIQAGASPAVSRVVSVIR